MPKIRRSDLLTTTVDGEVVIFDQAAGVVHQLNRTASHIWSLCDGEPDIDDISARLAASFDDVPAAVTQDIVKTLADFERLGLLVDSPVDVSADFERGNP
jgi:PqqD family protein of HPr-rel-A system